MTWPGCKFSCAQLEKRPSATRLTATRRYGSFVPEQIEYERRTSSSPRCVRSVRYCPCVKRNRSRRSAGTSNVTTIASRVSAATSLIVRG